MTSIVCMSNGISVFHTHFADHDLASGHGSASGCIAGLPGGRITPDPGNTVGSSALQAGITPRALLCACGDRQPFGARPIAALGGMSSGRRRSAGLTVRSA